MIHVHCCLVAAAGAMVFFMQAGFAMLEAGIVQPKNITNILFKNVTDACIAAICFWLLGYGFAYGKDQGGFIGGSNFALSDSFSNSGGAKSDGYEDWFFKWAFAAVVATIVTGAVAERTKVEAYFTYTIVLTAFIYPVVVHWGWGSGWLSAWGAFPTAQGVARPIFRYDQRSNGMIDFAGSGIVHMVGGFSALVGAIIVGPRVGRFDPDTRRPYELTAGNKALQALGTLILWFGWYGFNCGSTLILAGGEDGINAGGGKLAGKVAMTTTLSAASGGLSCVFITLVVEGEYDITMLLKGVLGGLVGISANCAVVDPWHAAFIGAISGFVFYVGHHLLFLLRIDDPCDSSVVHGFCGVWGMLATGIFCTDKNIQYAAYPNINDACGRGEQFGVQLIGVLVIICWTVATAGFTFFLITVTVGLRVDIDTEEEGIDLSTHGGPADDYQTNLKTNARSIDAKIVVPPPAPMFQGPTFNPMMNSRDALGSVGLMPSMGMNGMAMDGNMGMNGMGAMNLGRNGVGGMDGGLYSSNGMGGIDGSMGMNGMGGIDMMTGRQSPAFAGGRMM